MILPPDMALDHELRRWAPADVSLLCTRTPYTGLPVSVEMAERLGDPMALSLAVRDLAASAPAVYAYGCTSAAFVHGTGGERLLVDAMLAAGAPAAFTAAGALRRALAHLGVRRVAVATPYDLDVTERLRAYLAECRVEVVSSAHLGMAGGIWAVPYSTTADLVMSADHVGAQAVVISCTNLPTYDVIAPLEAALGKPVVTANQATMWAALRAIGRSAVGPRQRLLAARRAPGPRTRRHPLRGSTTPAAV
ncbi:aspartate racemase/maleate isomerase family protein [Georgenia subflava]